MLNLPSVALRLSRRQVLTLSNSLAIIVERRRRASHSGSSIRRVLRPGPGPGLHDQSMMDVVSRNHGSLVEILSRPPQVKYRLKLDALDLALLLFAARIGRKYASAEPQVVPTRHTLLMLERYRKRAQREAIAALGRPAYEALQGRWVSFLRWVRFNLFPSRSQIRGTGTLQRHYRRIVDRLSAAAQQGLAKRGVKLKPSVVRLLVRRALRYVRREGGQVTLQDLQTIPGLAEQHLSECILSAMQKQTSTSPHRSNHES